MEARNSQSQLATFYCFCSEMSYQDILQKQKNHSLEFSQFLDKHTNCNKGCGSCIENLYAYLSEAGCLIE